MSFDEVLPVAAAHVEQAARVLVALGFEQVTDSWDAEESFPDPIVSVRLGEFWLDVTFQLRSVL